MHDADCTNRRGLAYSRLLIGCQKVPRVSWGKKASSLEITDKSLAPALSVALTLLVISVFINYVDRGNLSVAAPLLKNELSLSASQLGILLSAFFWTYTAMLFLCGWFVDRFDPGRVLALGYLVWSVA